MRKHIGILLLLFMFAVSTLKPVLAAEVYPEVTVSDIIVYGAGDRQVASPSFLQIVYRGEEDNIIRSEWLPLEDPSKYKYSIIYKNYRFEKQPPQVVEVGGGRFLLSYFVTVSAIPYASKELLGYFMEHVKVVCNVYIYVRVDKPPEPGTYDLAEAISKAIGMSHLNVLYEVKVRREEPTSETFTVTEGFALKLRDAVVNVYRLSASVGGVENIGIKEFGNLTSGTFGFSPLVNILVDICLEGPRTGYSMDGFATLTTTYGSFENSFSVSAGRCVLVKIENVAIPPGNYSGAQSLLLEVRTGAVYLPVPLSTTIRGVSVVVRKPLAFLENIREDLWTYKVNVPVEVYSYPQGTLSAYITVRSGLETQSITTEVTCGKWVYSSTLLECSKDVYVSKEEIEEPKATTRVSIRYYGKRIESEATTDVSLIYSANISGMVTLVYRSLVNLLVYAVIAAGILTGATYALRILGYRLFPEERIYGVLVSLSVTLIMLYLIPYVHIGFFGLLNQIPEFRSVGIYFPSKIGRPEEVFAYATHYYDKLFTDLRADFKTYYEMTLVLGVILKLSTLGSVVLFYIALASKLAPLMNAVGAGRVVSALATLIISSIFMLILTIPGVAIFLALLSLSEALVVLVGIVILALIGLGVFMLVFSTLTNFGTLFVGAGLFYILTVPLIGPVLYGIYKISLSSLDYLIQQIMDKLGTLSLAGLEIALPFLELIRITGFLLISNLILASLFGTLSIILSRTEIASGFGQAIRRLLS